jgi:hypothetical protein
MKKELKRNIALYKESVDGETKGHCCLLVAKSKFSLLLMKIQDVPTRQNDSVREIMTSTGKISSKLKACCLFFFLVG